MKKFIVIMLSTLLFVFIFANAAIARLTVAGPAQMLNSADLIIVGTVLNRNYSDNVREVQINVESVLKGTTDRKILKLRQEKDMMYGWLGFNFPEEGTKIMILLGKDEGSNNYRLLYDLNNVATVDRNGNVKLYQGSTVNSKPPELYEKEFSTYYKNNYKPVKTLEQQDDAIENKVSKPMKVKPTAIIFVGLSLLIAAIVAKRFRR